jgi:hypothetical protein
LLNQHRGKVHIVDFARQYCRAHFAHSRAPKLIQNQPSLLQ